MVNSNAPNAHALPDVIQPGLSEYHTKELILPLFGSLALSLTPRILERSALPRSANALLAGLIVGGLSYLIGWLLQLKEVVGKAVLIGLIHAKFSVFATSHRVPAAIHIAFFLFIYLYCMLDL